jgi:hypothetical protein
MPIFKCQVIVTIVSQYCGHWSSAGVTRYIRFREPKALEAWQCRQARSNGKVIMGGRTIQATVGGKWHCGYPELRECHGPAMLPVDEVRIESVK